MAYKFQNFTIDGQVVTQNPTSFVMDKAKSVVANYELVELGTVNFSGSVSAQAAAGETVTVTITKPDGSTTTIKTPTKADKTFGPISYTDVVGNYSAKASLPQSEDANNIYLATTSSVVSFSLTKTSVTRTITLMVA